MINYEFIKGILNKNKETSELSVLSSEWNVFLLFYYLFIDIFIAVFNNGHILTDYLYWKNTSRLMCIYSFKVR